MAACKPVPKLGQEQVQPWAGQEAPNSHLVRKSRNFICIAEFPGPWIPNSEWYKSSAKRTPPLRPEGSSRTEYHPPELQNTNNYSERGVGRHPDYG